MSAATTDAPAAIPVEAKCRYCNGAVELIGRGRYNVRIERCRSCGREPAQGAPAVQAPSSDAPRRVEVDVSRAPTVARVVQELARESSIGSGPCPVPGCPGTRLATGCACCQRRAAWLEAHAPKRTCEICEGEIRGRANLKLCPACKPVKQSVQVASAKAKGRGDG